MNEKAVTRAAMSCEGVSWYPVVFFWIPAKNCGNDRRWNAGMTGGGTRE